jgi:pantetheine-phosphate adenylyltransferase
VRVGPRPPVCRFYAILKPAGCISRHVTKRNIIIYPGSFDPPTNGHLDLTARAATLFDEVVVAVLSHDRKDPLFTVEERVEMLRGAGAALPNVAVESFDGLLVDFVRAKGARLILRGIRAVSDYEYELQMALMNRKLSPDLETVFMLPAEAYSYVSSRLVKEVWGLGGDIHDLVPDIVEQRLQKKRGKS